MNLFKKIFKKKERKTACNSAFKNIDADPSGSYTGNYINGDGKIETPVQDADDL